MARHDEQQVDSSPRLSVSPGEVVWSGSSETIGPQSLDVRNVGGGQLECAIEACPWWLDTRADGSTLALSLRNCGRFSGTLVIRSNGGRQSIPVRSDVRSSRGRRATGFWRGAHAVWALLLVIGLSIGLGRYSYGSVLAVAALLWSWRIGGRRLVAISVLPITVAGVLSAVGMSMLGRGLAGTQSVMSAALLLSLALWSWFVGGLWFAIRAIGWAACFGIPAVVLSATATHTVGFPALILFLAMPFLYAGVLGSILAPCDAVPEQIGRSGTALLPTLRHMIVRRPMAQKELAASAVFWVGIIVIVFTVGRDVITMRRFAASRYGSMVPNPPAYVYTPNPNVYTPVEVTPYKGAKQIGGPAYGSDASGTYTSKAYTVRAAFDSVYEHFLGLARRSGQFSVGVYSDGTRTIDMHPRGGPVRIRIRHAGNQQIEFTITRYPGI